MSITGPADEADSPGYKVGVAIADIITGLTAATSILAALHHSQQTGAGQYVDIALFDAQVAALVNIASNYLVTGDSPQRLGNAHPSIVPYQTFKTANGDYLVVGAGSKVSQFAALCRVLGLQLDKQTPFKTNADRVQNRAELIPILEQVFLAESAAHWETLLLEAGIPAGIVSDVGAALDSTQVQARGLIHDTMLPDQTPLRMVGPPAQLSATPTSIRRSPPLLGQHSEEILREDLQMNQAEIQVLRERGVFG
jgi:crotonobetainyl-CoA:carnitine CoA-transferase CaiB-like acyl-CoA transferase